MSILLTTMINSLNPHTSTSDSDSDSDSAISIQWWCGLSFGQQQFISSHYQSDVGTSPYAILLAYRARHDLRGLPEWPVTTFIQI